MASITTWKRLEPAVTGAPEAQTLQARVYDPLWLLARQWQFGEFKGEDNGSPVSAQLRAECARLTRYRPAALPPPGRPAVAAPRAATPGAPYDPRTLPLETLVEREPVRPAPGQAERLRVATDAGQHFLRLLSLSPLKQRYHAAFIRDFPLPNAPADTDSASLRFLEMFRGRVPDGAQLFVACQQPAFPATLAILPADAAAARQVADAFLVWYDGLFSEPGTTAAAWVPQRLEYGFSVAAPTQPETVLTSQYYEGEIDWFDFDTRPGATLGAAQDRVVGQNPLPLVQTVMPAPVTYRGMPASRWWEFEDARVDFGAVDADPEDLARMLMVDFAITYGNDWFVVPVELPVGSYCQIQSLIVTDTFGVKTQIPSIQASTHPLSAAWRMFSYGASEAGLFLAPASVRNIEGRPIEDVLFLRDEMANLAWGVERVTEGVSGDAVNRRELHVQQEQARAAGPPAEAGQLRRWRLSMEVPDYWVPLVPVTIGSGAIALRRGAMLRPDGSLRPQTAQGRLLMPEPTKQLDIAEEEVPREGVRVTRSYQYTRWIDGRPYLWIGRRKQIGHGEGSSGLRFDALE